MKKHYAKIIAEQFPISRTSCQRANMSALLDRKGTLVTRPMEKLLEDPHLLSGWLSINTNNFRIENGKVVWLQESAGRA